VSNFGTINLDYLVLNRLINIQTWGNSFRMRTRWGMRELRAYPWRSDMGFANICCLFPLLCYVDEFFGPLFYVQSRSYDGFHYTARLNHETGSLCLISNDKLTRLVTQEIWIFELQRRMHTGGGSTVLGRILSAGISKWTMSSTLSNNIFVLWVITVSQHVLRGNLSCSFCN